jgi:hypothetical protein
MLVLLLASRLEGQWGGTHLILLDLLVYQSANQLSASWRLPK